MNYFDLSREQLLEEIQRLKTELTNVTKAQSAAPQPISEQQFGSNDDHYRIIAEAATDAFIVIDENSTILSVNTALEHIFGYNRHQLLGQSATMLMPEYLRQLHEKGLERYIITAKRHVNWQSTETYGMHQAGSEIPLEIAFSEFQRDGKHFFTAIIRDITFRKQTERDLKTQLAVTTILAKASTLREATPLVLKTIAQQLGWVVAIFWQPDTAAKTLFYLDGWHLTKELDEFVAYSQQHSFSIGSGLPGRAWESGTAVWFNNLTTDTNFARRSLALKAGLHSACAIPIHPTLKYWVLWSFSVPNRVSHSLI